MTDVDVQHLIARYRAERDRRLRDDGNAQYVEMTGDLARYLDDPWADPSFARDALTESCEVLVVGGGFGGLLAAARMREAGIDDVRIVEKGDDFGGTWYWNRYPGAACDTESYIYLPLLEETGYIPRRKYAPGPEILEHARRIGRHYDLYERALFQTVITGMRWSAEDAHWLVETDRGDALRAHYVVLAGGPLHRPKLPGIPGLQSFAGHSFHTSRWDYAYTGGDGHGDLTGLADKRVGIVGTGATGVQCVPNLGESARELYVFQRTPSSIDVRADRETDDAWVTGLEPGWQRERIDNFTTVVSGGDFDVDLVADGWTDVIGSILLAARRAAASGESAADPLALMQLADFTKMESVRARVDELVEDPATAALLKPWYSLFCKRPCFHDAYLQTFNRPNVTLVDTAGKGVERITERGVVVGGHEYELDCLIYGTGFEVGSSYTSRIGFDPVGRDGVALSEAWADGPETLHGMFTRGFPNCLLLMFAQSGQSPNFIHMLDEESRHLAWLLGRLRERGARSFEPTADAQDEWVARVVRAARGRAAYLQECTPGYYNLEGTLGDDERTLRGNPYWRGPNAYLRVLEQWRADGTLPGLEIER